MVPWHPPCALISLIFSSLFVLRPIVFLCFTTYLASSFRSPLSSFATGLFRSNLFLLCSCQGARRVSVSFLLSKILRSLRVRYSVFRPNPENDTEFKTQSTINLHDSRLPCSCSRSHAFLLLLQRFGFRLSVSISRFLLSSAYRSTLGEPLSFLFGLLPRKEVIQPHLPIRLPCYDFTPVIGLALGGWLLAVTSPTLGTPNSHGVTGGVYKARERIHRGMLIRDY